jgi:hypothetical protein
MLQNARCIAFFPAMLPSPGYYPASPTLFLSCVPPSACPGADIAAVRTAFALAMATNGSEGYILDAMEAFFAVNVSTMTGATSDQNAVRAPSTA